MRTHLFFYNATCKPMRVVIPLRTATYACSACCLLWFAIACIFAGVFGWAYTREADLKTECVRIQLTTNTSTYSHGYFDADGTECVYSDRLPKVCEPYFKDVSRCPTTHSRALDMASATSLRFSLPEFVGVVVDHITCHPLECWPGGAPPPSPPLWG